MIYCPKCGKASGSDPASSVALCADCVAVINLKTFSRISASYPNYQNTDTSRLPQKAYIEAMKWGYSPRGMMIQGTSGKGKTRIFWQVLKKAITTHKSPCSVFVFDCVSFGHELSLAYKNNNAEEWLASVANADIAAFDDIGKEKLTDRVESELFGVVEKRMARMKPIIATSEETGPALSARISTHRGPALVRRLRECCEVINVI